MAQFTRCSLQPQNGFCVSWVQIAADHDAVVDNYLDNLYSNCAMSENAASTLFVPDHSAKAAIR